MQTDHNVRLTSAEMASLWTTYMNDSMAICVLKYFLAKVEDSEIHPLIELALKTSENHVEKIKTVFESENHPIPVGFTDEDVNLNAPRLFADTYFLYYLRNMAKFGLAAYGLALSTAAREDTMNFFSEALAQSSALQMKVSRCMLSKGIYIRPPYISTPEKVDFVKKQSFLTGWFGDQRTLLGVEIAHIYLNLTNNALGKALIMGFSQVAQSEEVRKYMKRGFQLAAEQIKILQSIMNKEHLPSPMTWDTDVMDSKAAPFSDKLMMFHTIALAGAGIANYGGGMSISLRRDLVSLYGRLMAESGQYAEDGVNIMINQGWLEEQPQADNREALTQV
jgi:hypothetical protein